MVSSVLDTLRCGFEPTGAFAILGLLNFGEGMGNVLAVTDNRYTTRQCCGRSRSREHGIQDDGVAHGILYGCERRYHAAELRKTPGLVPPRAAATMVAGAAY